MKNQEEEEDDLYSVVATRSLATVHVVLKVSLTVTKRAHGENLFSLPRKPKELPRRFLDFQLRKEL